MDRVFFTNSGTEAIEGALKLARLAARQRRTEGKTRILALENSFHGRTFGALSITHPAKYREPFAPLVAGVEFVRFNDVADLEAKFDDSVCAIVIEPMQGEGGIYPISTAFWTRARELGSHYGAALIADEIQSGLGRTGRAFAYQRHGSLPDMVVVAKPLAGGLPLGAILARESFAECLLAGLAWVDIRGRSAGVRRGAGVFVHNRRGRSAGKHSRSWRAIALGTDPPGGGGGFYS